MAPDIQQAVLFITDTRAARSIPSPYRTSTSPPILLAAFGVPMHPSLDGQDMRPVLTEDDLLLDWMHGTRDPFWWGGDASRVE